MARTGRQLSGYVIIHAYICGGINHEIGNMSHSILQGYPVLDQENVSLK